MKTFKKIFLLLMVITLSASMMVACGGSAAPAAESAAPAEDAESAPEVPTYTVVTEATFPPFDTTDENGEFTGFDRELMDAIAADQGFNVEYLMISFDALIPALESNQAQIIAAAMSNNPERLNHINFSETYFDAGIVVMVKSENEDVKSVDDLTADMTVSSQIGTTSSFFALDLKDQGKLKECITNNEFTLCAIQLNNGDVDAAILDKPLAEYLVKKYDGKLKIVGETLESESYVFGITKGDEELTAKINAGLAHMVENGTYDALLEKWMGTGSEE